MTNDRFNEIARGFFSFLEHVSATKGKEYANGEDRLGNFKREALKLDVMPETVCHIYLAKHLDSIDHFVKNVQTTGVPPPILSEPIHGRIGDAIVYLMLLDALIVEREEVIAAMSAEADAAQTRELARTFDEKPIPPQF